MSTYSWHLPSPAIAAAASSSASLGSPATAKTALGGLLDMFVDPVTLDYADTEDGEWLETADSRTIVLCMLEIRLGSSYSAPNDGTSIKDKLDAGDPVTPDFVVAETSRAMQLLVDEGLIDEISVGTDTDQAGRFVLVLRWRDLANGSPVDLV